MYASLPGLYLAVYWHIVYNQLDGNNAIRQFDIYKLNTSCQLKIFAQKTPKCYVKPGFKHLDQHYNNVIAVNTAQSLPSFSQAYSFL